MEMVGRRCPQRLRMQPCCLSDGSIADITIFDPDAKITVDSKKFKSKSRNTAFEGKELFGKVAATIVDGEIIYKNEN